MAKEYAAKVYISTKFPRHEDYGLRSQMNRAANSISLNIGGGSAKGSNVGFDYTSCSVDRFKIRSGRRSVSCC